MGKTKKIIKCSCTIAAVLLTAALLLIGSFVYVTEYQIGDIASSSAPDGEYEILYQSVGEPDWPFGYSHARLVLKRGGKTVTKLRFDVANDGGTLYADSWNVNWKTDAVEVTISGEEQRDERYTLHFDGTAESIQLETKGGK